MASKEAVGTAGESQEAGSGRAGDYLPLLDWFVHSGSQRVLGDAAGVAPSVQPEIALGSWMTSGPEGGERPVLSFPSP